MLSQDSMSDFSTFFPKKIWNSNFYYNISILYEKYIQLRANKPSIQAFFKNNIS